MKTFMASLCMLCSFFVCNLYAYAKDTIIVSIAPQAYFLKQIVGDTQNIITFLPDGADPHTFEPSVQILKKMSDAKLFFTIGIGLEQQWEKRLHAVAPTLRFIPSYVERPQLYSLRKDTTLIHEHDEEGHNHDDHNHARFKELEDGSFIPINQHVWMSPNAMRVIVEQMLTALVRQYPQYLERYTKEASSLLNRIDETERYIYNALKGKRYRTFLSYHPAWNYFANDYMLKELVIEENEREPSAKAIVTLIKKAKEAHIRIILTQPQFSQKSVQIISKELGGIPIVIVDPLQENWFMMMKQMKDTLQEHLE